MKMSGNIKSSLIVILLTLVCSAFGQITSFSLQSKENDPSSEGFVYSLPLSIVKIDVHVTKTEKFKGKYSDYASKLLGIKEIILKDAMNYDISDIFISTITEIDTNHFYFAQVPDKMPDGHSLMLSMTEKGFITGLYSVSKTEAEAFKKTYADTPFRDLLKPIQIEKVDTIIRRVSIDTLVFEEKVLKRSISEKSNEQQAKEIADIIYNIEDSKYSLFTGYQEVNYSKESLDFMLNNLNKLENEYLAYFKGSTILTDEVFTFYYVPSTIPTESIYTLFHFSATEGISPKYSQNGEAVSISIISLNKYSQVHDFERRRMHSKRKAKGLFYRIPESVKIDIKLGNRVLASENADVSQMGILTFLPYKNISRVDFNGNGTLRSITIE